MSVSEIIIWWHNDKEASLAWNSEFEEDTDQLSWYVDGYFGEVAAAPPVGGRRRIIIVHSP